MKMYRPATALTAGTGDYFLPKPVLTHGILQMIRSTVKFPASTVKFPASIVKFPASTALCRASTILCRASTALCRASTALCRASTALCRASTALCRASTALCRASTVKFLAATGHSPAWIALPHQCIILILRRLWVLGFFLAVPRAELSAPPPTAPQSVARPRCLRFLRK